MNWLRSLSNGLKSLFQKGRVERELDEELGSYLDASAADKQRNGMGPEAARRAALVEMGSRNSVKHQVWSSRWESTVDGVLQDLRLSVRMLAKSPGFTAVALLSLALGIGANTAIFTLIDQVLLRNLPVRDPQQLVTFGRSDGGGINGGIDLGTLDMFTYDFARQLEANPGPFESVASYSSFAPRVSVRNGGSAGPAAQVGASLVSGNYFSVLGAAPLMGRTIQPSDADAPGRNPVVDVSYHYWQQSLSADPAAVGKTVTVNGAPFTVIGVMPERFHGIKQDAEPPDLWTPVTMEEQVFLQPTFLQPRSYYFLHMFARRGTQTTVASDQQWLDQQVRAYVRAGEGANVSPERQREIGRLTVRLVSGAHGVSSMRSQYGDSLPILMAVVALVLLIACANLANFLLARAAGRQREYATRLALGSSAGRIVRQGLIETLLLSMTGGLLGLGIAFAATRALIAFVAQGASYTALTPTPDAPVLLFTLAVSLATAVLFGLAPALSASRPSAALALNANARTQGSGGGRAARLWPRALVVSQVMLSLLLLVGAGLFIRTLRNLQGQDYGFERSHLLLGEFDEKLAGYKPSQAAALNQQLIEKLEALPGVQSAALAETPPIGLGNWYSTLDISGYTPGPQEDMGSALNRVSGHYFETVGIPMATGRAINNADSASGLKVAVISQSLSRRFFPRGDAIGRRFTIGSDTVAGPWQIVGVARDTKFGNPRDPAPAARMVYIPLSQITGTNGAGNNDSYASMIHLRTIGDPANAVAGLRAAVAAVDPNLPILQVHTITEQVDSLMSHEELISRLTGMFSLLALLLACIGLYGVMSYSVARRTSELGLRLALGAQAPAVLWMVMRESLLLLVFGLALGLPLTLAATGVVKEQLYGLSALDPETFAAAMAIVTAMTLVAAWLPARRASRVNPMVALRCD